MQLCLFTIYNFIKEPAMINKNKKNYLLLVDYLKKELNIEVIQKPNADDAWYPRLNKIYINSNLKYRERLYTLLHESGHAFIDKNDNISNNICFNKNTFKSAKSRKHLVCTLNEEILAWNYGKTIAKSLDIYIDNVIYENCMTDAIMSYIKSGLNKVYGKNINADIIKTYYV